MAYRTDAVELRSRLHVSDVESAIGFDSGDLPDPSMVGFWLLSAKQSADQYLNRLFEGYSNIPEPVEQGIIAYVREMLYAHLDSMSVGGSIDDGDAASELRITSIKVGDQSISYAPRLANSAGASERLSAAYGIALEAAKEFWAQYRFHPLM